MFKNKKSVMIVLGIIIGVVILVSVGIWIVNDDSDYNFKDEYEKLNGVSTRDGNKYPDVTIPLDNIVRKVDYDTVIDILNKGGNGVIYLGYPKCVYCRSAVQVLLDTAKDTELSEILYLDIEKKNKKYKKLMKVMDEKFIVTEEKKIYAPLVLFVVEGEIVSYNKGTVSTHTDPYKEMGTSQIRGLAEIYKYGIRDVLKVIDK